MVLTRNRRQQRSLSQDKTIFDSLPLVNARCIPDFTQESADQAEVKN
jgi:hypothetical protein